MMNPFGDLTGQVYPDCLGPPLKVSLPWLAKFLSLFGAFFLDRKFMTEYKEN